MTATRPRLIVTASPDDKWRERWNALTAEDRKRMTVPELIKAMGPLHAMHPDYKERPQPLIPMPNYADKQLVISGYKAGFWAEFKRAFRWTV